MRLIYDQNTRIAGIGVTPWTRLGLEQWFPGYKIVSCHDGGASGLMNMPEVLLVGDVQLAKKNTQCIICTEAFKQLAQGKLAGYSFMTYKPVVVDDPALASRFLMNGPQYTKTYENKAWLRETFGADLPFAPYLLFQRTELQPTQASYDELSEFGSPVVLQHEQLSGGKGTYVVRSFTDYVAALSALPASGKIVVSRYLDGARERSLQCCVTRFGTICSDMQKQIVRNEYLCNLNVPVVNGFCGAELGTVTLTPVQQAVVAKCSGTIGKRLAADGYKGIFGIDFLMVGDNVYLLEVNARLTGVTPLHTMTYRPDMGIPFYVLHTLELKGEPYTIEATDSSEIASPASMLVLQSLEASSCLLSKGLAPGIYSVEKGSLTLVRKDTRFAETDPLSAILVQAYVATGALVKPGERLMTIMLRRPVLDDNDELDAASRQLVRLLYKALKFE